VLVERYLAKSVTVGYRQPRRDAEAVSASFFATGALNLVFIVGTCAAWPSSVRRNCLYHPRWISPLEQDKRERAHTLLAPHELPWSRLPRGKQGRSPRRRCHKGI